MLGSTEGPMRVPSRLAPEEQWRLARLAAAGDSSARDALIDSHRDGVHALACAAVGAERADGATAEVLVELRRLYGDADRGFEPNRGFLFGLWCAGTVRSVLERRDRPAADSEALAPSVDPAADARAGRLAPLAARCGADADGAIDALTWLLTARDFGHPADPWIDDLYEMSALRADDDGLATAAAHWSLAMRYLEGADGLTVDLTLARTHLAEALERHATFEALRPSVPPRWHPESVAPRLHEAALAVLRAATPDLPSD